MDCGGAPQKHHERCDHAGHHRFEAIKAELSQLVHNLLGWLHSLAAVHTLRLGAVGSRGVAGRQAVSRGSRCSRRSRPSRRSRRIRGAGGLSVSLQQLLQAALDQGAHVFLQLVLQRPQRAVQDPQAKQPQGERRETQIQLRRERLDRHERRAVLQLVTECDLQ